MNALYCHQCDTILVRRAKSGDPVPVVHVTESGEEHRLKHMGWFHPDFKQCEVEGTVRHNIETFGIGVNPPKLHDAWSLTSE